MSTEWSGVNIVQNLFPIFGCPLTLVGMRATRSIKMRQMKVLVESGRIRIESLFVNWHLHGARSRIKKLGELVLFSCLRELDLGGCASLRSAGTTILAESLGEATCLRKLGLRACQIGPEGAMMIAALLDGRRGLLPKAESPIIDAAQAPALVSLQPLDIAGLGHVAVEDVGEEEVGGVDGVAQVTGEEADVEANGDIMEPVELAVAPAHGDSAVADAAATAAAGVEDHALAGPAHQEQEHISAPAQLSIGLEAMSTHLASNMTRQHSMCGLTSLDLQDNGMGSEGAALIAAALIESADTCRLASLNLSLNNMRSEGATAVAKALESNSNITHLNLSWNLIRSPGAKALAVAITASTTLRELDLGFNLLRCTGTGLLAPALTASRSLAVLSLRRNELGPEGATQLAGALRGNTSLHTLNLGLNGIATLGAAKIGEALAHNSTLQHLDLDWNALRQLGLLLLTSGLRSKCRLTFLDLSHNKLEGSRNLASALRALALSRQHAHDAARHAAMASFLDSSPGSNCNAVCEGAGRLLATRGADPAVGAHGEMNGHSAANQHDAAPRAAASHASIQALSVHTELGPLPPSLQLPPTVPSLTLSHAMVLVAAAGAGAAAAAENGDGIEHQEVTDYVATSGVGEHSTRDDVSARDVRREFLPVALMRGNNLRCEGLAAMLPALRPDLLGALDLSDNNLGDAGCQLLAHQGSHLLRSLLRLNLSGNAITSVGLEALAVCLSGSTLLQELKISRNHIQVCPPPHAPLPPKSLPTPRGVCIPVCQCVTCIRET